MHQGVVLSAVVVLVAGLVLGGRLLARRGLGRLRGQDPRTLWRALGTASDGRPTVVAFSTPSCAACRSAQRPALAALEERFQGDVRILQVDAAERPDVAHAFCVMTVPATVVLDESGAVLAANQGFATTERLTGQLGRVRPARSA